MIYLFAQTLPSQALGAYFTFSDNNFYMLYVSAPRVWTAITPSVDQQLGGLIMWVIGGTFFLGVFASVFLRWVSANEAKEQRRYRAVKRPG
jgi:cytochrome c oxidase assembly factor CtaG